MDIAQMIKHNYEDNDKRALITLFHAVMIEKEADRKPDEYYSCHYRDGIEVMNFLCDVVNDLAGYTNLYYDEMKMTEEEWKAKIKPMRQNHDDPYLKDSYPHVLVVIEKAEKLLKMNDVRAVDWLETVIMRFLNTERFRRHFPIILESSHSLYFGFEIFDRLNLHALWIPNLDFEGYSMNAKFAGLSQIYNADQIKLMNKYIGDSIFHTHIVTEVAVRSDQLFPDVIENVSNLAEFRKIRIQFHHKINKLFTNPRLGPELDSGEIDMMILNAINSFVRSKHKGFNILFHCDRELFRTDIIRAMIEEELTYAEKHMLVIDFAQPIYQYFAKEYIKKTKAEFSLLNKYLYHRYRFNNFISFGTIFEGNNRNVKMPFVAYSQNKTYRYELSKLYWKE